MNLKEMYNKEENCNQKVDKYRFYFFLLSYSNTNKYEFSIINSIQFTRFFMDSGSFRDLQRQMANTTARGLAVIPFPTPNDSNWALLTSLKNFNKLPKKYLLYWKEIVRFIKLKIKLKY